MNIVYNSEHFSVLAYPPQYGFELVDKAGGRVLFLEGASARQFHAALAGIPEAERDVDRIDAFLDDYCFEAARPIVFH